MVRYRALPSLEAEEILDYAFEFMNLEKKKKAHQNIERFHKNFGSDPLVISDIWADLISQKIITTKKDRSDWGLIRFFVAIHFMWAYPRSADLLAQAFDDSISVNDCYGKPLWIWVQRIGALKSYVIVFDPELELGAINIATVDGTDFLTNEQKTGEFNIDSKMMSHKFHHGGLKHIIAISIWRAKMVYLSTSTRGGESDKNMYMEELHDLIPEGKCVICDRAFASSDDKDEESAAVAKKLRQINDDADSDKVKKFKARALARHETLNGRLKNYAILRSYFRHDKENHGDAFEAVCVMVQYQMDRGHPIFDSLSPDMVAEEKSDESSSNDKSDNPRPKKKAKKNKRRG